MGCAIAAIKADIIITSRYAILINGRPAFHAIIYHRLFRQHVGAGMDGCHAKFLLSPLLFLLPSREVAVRPRHKLILMLLFYSFTDMLTKP